MTAHNNRVPRPRDHPPTGIREQGREPVERSGEVEPAVREQKRWGGFVAPLVDGDLEPDLDPWKLPRSLHVLAVPPSDNWPEREAALEEGVSGMDGPPPAAAYARPARRRHPTTRAGARRLPGSPCGERDIPRRVVRCG